MPAGQLHRRAFMLPRVDGVALAETFLVSAVTTVLVIRAYLIATRQRYLMLIADRGRGLRQRGAVHVRRQQPHRRSNQRAD